MKILWNNVLERGTASSVIAKGSPVYAREIGLRWEINYGDWCNADLENGKVDMMIGRFDAKRENVVYPSKLGFSLSASIISTANVCFTSVTGIQLGKVRNGMEGGSSFIVGIEAGFSKQHSSKMKPQWIVLFNPTEKYRMFEKGRVDAIVRVFTMDADYPIETKAEWFYTF
jgi:hypothetical protein